MFKPSRSSPRASYKHRVLLYTTCYNVLDGVTLTVRKLEEEILAAGHHVLLLTTVSGDPTNTNLVSSHPNRRVLFLDNAKPIPFVHDPNNPEHIYQIGFGLSAAVRAELDAFEPSIIHLTCPDCTALHLIQYARTKEIPIMGTYHSNIPEYMEHYPGLSWLKHILAGFFRHQYNFLQALYVPTPFIQRHLTEHYKMDRVTNLGVWGHGVDIQKFHPAHRSLQYRRSLGIADHQVVVCWCSRLVPEKRPDIFCQVVRRLQEQNLPFHALVIGAGPCEEEIKSLPNTTFAGWMNEDQLSVAYASADIFLFPSAVETFGLVTLEAAASGLPVIVESSCSGHLVRNGETGFACPPDDEDAFFEATRQLVEDHAMRRSFSQASRQLSLTWEKRAIIRKMMDNYSHVTESFFTEYGGHHECRDDEYRKTDSFVAGEHPRPLLFVMVEWLFLGLFYVIWNMINMIGQMQASCLSVRLWGRVEAVETNETNERTSSTSPSNKAPATEASSSDSSFSSVVELSKVVEDDSAEGDRLSDDGTDSTTSSTTASLPDELVVVTTSSSSMSSDSIVPPKRKAFGDRQLSHSLAKGFISAMQFQCRMESNVRSWFKFRRSIPVSQIKRKDSNFAADMVQHRQSYSNVSSPPVLLGRSSRSSSSELENVG